MTDLLPLLQEFHKEKLAALLSHQAAARVVGQYDINNTYQYIVNREETALSWLAAAITELGGAVATDQSEPVRKADRKGSAAQGIFQEDAQNAQAFVDRWRPRVDEMTNARHAKMLRLILGEVLEQKRFFEQALAGRTDLLGRRGAQLGPSHGQVLPSRVDRVAAAIALGSNVGDRAAHLDYAISRLRPVLDDLRVSGYYETAAVDVPGTAAPFLNAAAVGHFRGTARQLLDLLHDVERERGRERPYQNAPRTLDLDLVLFGSEVSGDAALTLPHQRFRERRFVLEPLADIAPDMRDPVTGETVTELLRRLGCGAGL